jgi:NAD(P)-dependent dehydrogenase (short-subunit alcohol dehydrogenase family)
VVSKATVVITGATQGLGFGYARECLQRGCRVVISGRDAARVESAVSRLRAETSNAEISNDDSLLGTVCEVGDLASVQSLWDFAVKHFGRVDIWIHNAGYARTGETFLNNSPADIEAMVRTNVIGSINAAQVAVAGMRVQGAGRLYLTLGGGGGNGRLVPGMTVYSTTKRAVKYLVKSLLKERKEANDGILIGTISPGINLTEGMMREMSKLPVQARDRAMKQINFIGDHVETTTPWIIDRVLNDTKQGNEIVWLTSSRLARRSLGALLGQKRDVVSRYLYLLEQ